MVGSVGWFDGRVGELTSFLGCFRLGWAVERLGGKGEGGGTRKATWEGAWERVGREESKSLIKYSCMEQEAGLFPFVRRRFFRRRTMRRLGVFCGVRSRSMGTYRWVDRPVGSRVRLQCRDLWGFVFRVCFYAATKTSTLIEKNTVGPVL